MRDFGGPFLYGPPWGLLHAAGSAATGKARSSFARQGMRDARADARNPTRLGWRKSGRVGDRQTVMGGDAGMGR